MRKFSVSHRRNLSKARRKLWEDPAYREQQRNSRLGREAEKTPKATRTPTVEELHWAAGFFEGEGTAVRTNGNAAVRAYQKSKWPLRRLQELFGGSIYKCNDGCLRWSITGARARGFLMTIYPLLSPRRREQTVKALRG